MKVIQVAEGLSLYAENSLEEHRSQTLFTKEPETIEWIKEFVQNGDTFYDIGANIGVYSLYAARQHTAAQIYAFEPFLRNFVRLNENIALNKVSNVIPIYMGLSDNQTIDTFYIKDNRTGASGNQISENRDERGDLFQALQVNHVLTSSLDILVPAFSLNPPQHIKIDVDGAEARIIRGMRNLLQLQRLKSVLVEINLTSTDMQELLDIFNEAGFSRDNPFNDLPNHSRNRRKGTASEIAENVIFTRKRDS